MKTSNVVYQSELSEVQLVDSMHPSETTDMTVRFTFLEQIKLTGVKLNLSVLLFL